jgi:hypothetical protein
MFVVVPHGGAVTSALTPRRASTSSTLQGYDLVASDGGLFSFGSAEFDGSMGGSLLNAPVVGIANDIGTGGYWEVASDGGVFSFNAPFYGSMGGTPLNAPIVGMVSDNLTGGYWMVASDGGVFAFNAPFYGSMGGSALNQPIVGMAAMPFGDGYWLVAKDGGVFAFGDAGFYGSMGGTPLNEPVVGMAPNAFGNGYWLVAKDGGVFAFGSARFYGSMGGTALNAPVVGIARAPFGLGYWLVARDGGLFSFGDAQFDGSMGGSYLNAPIVGMAATPPAIVTTPSPTPLPQPTPPGQAMLSWYLANGATLNTVATAVSKLARTVNGTTPNLYSTIHPYWQELESDANSAMAAIPIPDAVTQSSWTTALSDLSQGAADCLAGTPAGFSLPICNQGLALISTGTTQLDSAIISVEAMAVDATVSSSDQVQAWYLAYGSGFNTLQTDLTALNNAFLTTPVYYYHPLVDPYWQQLATDAQHVMSLPAIPDAAIQMSWTMALNNLVQGSHDCLSTSEALPPSVFDQGVALIQTGTNWFNDTATYVRALAG